MRLCKAITAIFFYALTLCFYEIARGQIAKDLSPTQMLADKLNQKDSLLFDAVLHTCDQQTVESTLSPGFAYYQDKGDLQAASVTPRAEFLGNIKKRCERSRGGPQVKRTTSNVQAFPMDGHAALQTGIQRFYLVIPGQAEQLVEISRFSRVWTFTKGNWTIQTELDNVAEIPGKQEAAMKAQTVYKEIADQDSILFGAFNNRDFNSFKTFFASDLEFYQDRTGLTGYAWNMENFKKHLDDASVSIRRELVEGSLEVYPMNGYGAVEIGVHRFYGKKNGQENLEATAKFVTLWQKKDGEWKITREISFDHQ